MKTLTCKQMGGPCDAKLSAETPNEMMNVGMAHMEQAHPEMAADIKKMPKDDPAMTKWSQDFQKTWAEAPAESK